jgi:hypothetical protein
MSSTSNAQNIEKLNNNSFHPWKMKMEFLLHEKDLCKITLGELLPPEVEFGEVVFKRGVIEHRLFMEGTNWLVKQFLNVVDYLLHHVTCVETTKNAWGNLCGIFQKYMLAIDCNYAKNFTILKWKKAPECKFILTSFE